MPTVKIISVPAKSTNTCPDCLVDLQPCFVTVDSTGVAITTALLTDYVQMIAVKVCSLINSINTQGAAIKNLNTRVTTLEKAPPFTYQLPSLFPVCVGNPTISLPLDQLVAATEAALCELINATGTPNALFNSISIGSAVNINNQRALGTSGGVVSSLPGWVPDPKTAADTITNLWALILDARNAIQNILLNCCNSVCSAIEIALQATLTAPDTVRLFFTGTIPANYENCVTGGTLIKIADQSGNFINVTVDIKSALNDSSGFIVNISGSPLNVADDFDITMTTCFFDPTTNSQCMDCIEYHLVNTLSCPTVIWTPTENSVGYSFNHTGGALTYSVQLFNSGNVMVDNQSFSVTGPIAISGVFNGLAVNTTYKGRVQMITALSTKSCPFTTVITGPDSCPAVQLLTATITIP